ncbi:MAG: hypothetical protein ACI9JM_002583 [Halioglobus sp.]|jgi:hypothetical protein
MRTQKPLGLSNRFELAHPSLPGPGSLMRLLGPIILILIGTVYRVGYKVSMSNTIPPELVCHDLPRLTAMTS